MLGTLENLLNRGLPRSPRARQLCAELAGRSLAIEIRDIARLRVSSNGLVLSVSHDGEPADATVSGGPLGLAALAAQAPPAAPQLRGVTIGGDAELAQKFRELTRLLRPDLEEELSLVVGDVPAHQLGRLARLALDFGHRALATTVRNAAEYLAHERADLVSRNEGEQFLRGVDAVREDVDRLAVRLERIAARRGAP
ncbi:MAG TPA: SCP2 sterol-binding domain-containing protein [Steroidobacteraceae bacterium]|nr:SCP2 sterol-binding domain-containing protein [Steroidobacteraceae bacterium]